MKDFWVLEMFYNLIYVGYVDIYTNQHIKTSSLLNSEL